MQHYPPAIIKVDCTWEIRQVVRLKSIADFEDYDEIIKVERRFPRKKERKKERKEMK